MFCCFGRLPNLSEKYNQQKENGTLSSIIKLKLSRIYQKEDFLYPDSFHTAEF